MDQRTWGATAPPTWMWRSASSRGIVPIYRAGPTAAADLMLALVGRGLGRRPQRQPAVGTLALARRRREAVAAGGALDLAPLVEVHSVLAARRRLGRPGRLQQVGPVAAQELDGPGGFRGGQV